INHGDFELISSDEGMSVFKRTYKDKSIYIVINNDSESRLLPIESLSEDKQLRGLFGDNLVREDKNGNFRIGIPRESSEVYIVEDNTGINWFFIVPIIAVFIIFVVSVIYLSRKQKAREQQ